MTFFMRQSIIFSNEILISWGRTIGLSNWCLFLWIHWDFYGLIMTCMQCSWFLDVAHDFFRFALIFRGEQDFYTLVFFFTAWCEFLCTGQDFQGFFWISTSWYLDFCEFVCSSKNWLWFLCGRSKFLHNELLIFSDSSWFLQISLDYFS